MAEAFLQSLGKQTGSDLLETGISPHTDDPQWNKLLGLVNQQRLTYDRALLNDIGHGNRGMLKKKTLPVPGAEEKAKAIDAEIGKAIAGSEL